MISDMPGSIEYFSCAVNPVMVSKNGWARLFACRPDVGWDPGRVPNDRYGLNRKMRREGDPFASKWFKDITD
jgi:hypothetical protein